MKVLTRRGALIEEMGQTYLAEPDADSEEARTLRPLRRRLSPSASSSGRAPGEAADSAGRDAAGGYGSATLCADITGSACTPRCRSKYTTASGWNSRS